MSDRTGRSALTNGWIDVCSRYPLPVVLGVCALLVWGVATAPFDWHPEFLPRNPIPVDALPDIGENQQIVFTAWEGHSPQDVEDQITYPLTSALLGTPGVKTVRSYSAFGFSGIHLIFKEEVDFYWSRSRILERLNSLAPDALPAGIKPTLGPDATALGQVLWYTLEGLDRYGRPTGGWDLDELRSIQDWDVRLGLLATEGVSEVASIGGFVREYQIDVNPIAMKAFGVSLDDVFNAVRMANVDVGARTIEVNRVEYLIRGLGFIQSLEDLENCAVAVRDNVPVYVRNVAHVSHGPAWRRGALDKEGVEAVGGVVVTRFGENPLATLANLKKRITEMSPGLPRKTLPDGTVSQIAIVPFYDRSDLIRETLHTLNTTLINQILVTVLVVLLMAMHLRSSLLISGSLPLAVLGCFCAMKAAGVQANLVALSGIAIAIGTMVDIGIVICENILRRFEQAKPGEDRSRLVIDAAQEVGAPILTGLATTIISFLPVFTLTEAEGKLFRPLAFTKTFALIAAGVIALSVLPPLARFLFVTRRRTQFAHRFIFIALTLAGLGWLLFGAAGQQLTTPPWLVVGLLLIATGSIRLFESFRRSAPERGTTLAVNWLTILAAGLILSHVWMPLGPDKGLWLNAGFVLLPVGALLTILRSLQNNYSRLLNWCLRHRLLFLSLPAVLIMLGATIWLGFDRTFGWLPSALRDRAPLATLADRFPGLGKEFMPPLDEGSFLYMPTTMPHASIGEAMDAMRKQDLAIRSLPEVETVVGKLGRAETPLDPAPISMMETIVNYHPEYLASEPGTVDLFAFDPSRNDWFRDIEGTPLAAPDGAPYRVKGTFARDVAGRLIPDPGGRTFRLWRPPLDPILNPGRTAWPGINSSGDIWQAIERAARVPGSTSAPRLQPIAARIVMLQSGIRAPMGVKIQGPDLATIEQAALRIEALLKEVPAVNAPAVIADRIVGKPYLEIEVDRQAIARYGIPLAEVQKTIEVGIGGKRITTTVEGRERYPVRVRYQRELRDQIESLGKILTTAPDGVQIPLEQLAKIAYRRGPQVIRSEDTFLTGYVLFDGRAGQAEVDVVDQAREYLQRKIDDGSLRLPNGVRYTFTGTYENQIRSEKTLRLILPLALLIVFFLLYFHFHSVTSSLLVFSGILIAWAGGFVLLWLYNQEGFLNYAWFGISLRELFQVEPVNLSVAVWVGFLSLFGIASDNGVILTTYLDATFRDRRPRDLEAIRAATVEAGQRRARPCLMTIATTLLALFPVLTSSGRGSEIMIPMAIPTYGGMAAVILSIFVVPVLYCAVKEFAYRTGYSPAAVALLSVGSLFLIPAVWCSLAERREANRPDSPAPGETAADGPEETRK